MMMEGGCLCGQVRFRAEAEPLFQGICHCKNCQKQAGSAFTVIVGVPEAALQVTGELSAYEDHGDTGGVVERNFCPRCGSPVLSHVPAMPGIAMLKGGAMDDTSWLAPDVHIWTKSAMPFTEIPEGVTTYPGNIG